MPKELFHGSCHCGKIKFEANIDLAQGSGKCNCTFCRKNSYWSIKVPLEDFRLLEGEDSISKYSNNSQIGAYIFCKHCGSMPFALTVPSEWTKEGASIKVSSFDDMTVQEMNSMPISYYNGLDNTWSPITDPEIIKTMY
jgi:hypothetical protein